MYDNVDILELKNFPKLTYLNVSQSPELTTLHVDNTPNLKEIHASLCPKLTEVKLGAELNELEKLDISKSPVETFDTATKLRKLAYFIAFETKFKQLNLAHMSRIKYLIAPNSGILEIDWTKVKSLSRIESLELPEMYDSKDDALNEIIRNVSNEFPIRINKYLSRLLNDQYIGLKRIKILLLGNTTSGKSTLRRILFSKAGEEKKAALIKEESTAYYCSSIFAQRACFCNSHFLHHCFANSHSINWICSLIGTQYNNTFHTILLSRVEHVLCTNHIGIHRLHRKKLA